MNLFKVYIFCTDFIKLKDISSFLPQETILLDGQRSYQELFHILQEICGTHAEKAKSLSRVRS